MVKQAIARVAEVGMDKAKVEFMDHSGKYIDRDLYLIIIDKDGVRVVHGQNPKLVGKTYFDAVDVNGKEYGAEVQQIAVGPGKG
jgi:signal transduction histidine kinase